MHKAQCENEQRFGELHKGAKITAYVINICRDDAKGTCKIDLSLEENSKLTKLNKGDQCVGVIRNLQWESSYPLMVELSGYIKAAVYFRHLSKDPRELESLRMKLKEGGFITCYSCFNTADISGSKERLKVSLYSDWVEEGHETFKVGDLVVCRCIKSKDGHGVSVQLTEKRTGIIDITEISDEFTANPFATLTKKGVFAGRILEIVPAKGNIPEKICLSSRKSLVDDKLWKILHTSSTFEFQQNFDYITEEGDMRSKIIKQ